MVPAAAANRLTKQRLFLFAGAFVLLAVFLVLAVPQVAARSAQAAAIDNATEIGDALAARYTVTKTYPREVIGDNSSGNRPEIYADGKPLPGVALADGMAIDYYSAEADLDFALCLEHRAGGDEPNAFAVYSTGSRKNGDISQDEHGMGCASAE